MALLADARLVRRPEKSRYYARATVYRLVVGLIRALFIQV
jgi:hypothetical protein